MGKRAHKRKTRVDKEVAIRSEIRTGLQGGEWFRFIASYLTHNYGIAANEALRLVVDEYARSMVRAAA